MTDKYALGIRYSLFMLFVAVYSRWKFNMKFKNINLTFRSKYCFGVYNPEKKN